MKGISRKMRQEIVRDALALREDIQRAASAVRAAIGPREDSPELETAWRELYLAEIATLEADIAHARQILEAGKEVDRDEAHQDAFHRYSLARDYYQELREAQEDLHAKEDKFLRLSFVLEDWIDQYLEQFGVKGAKKP